jgi:plastocyanin
MMQWKALRRLVAWRLLAVLACGLAPATCVNDGPTGLGGRGRASLNFGAWAALNAPGTPPVPFDSIRIILRRPGVSTPALDTAFGFRTDTLRGDSATIDIQVPLQESPEDFILTVRLTGGGIIWYEATSPVRVSASGAATPVLAARYVGPGANAGSVVMAPVDTTAVGGETFFLQAVVYDSNDVPIPGVPVGYRLSDSTRGTVQYPTPYLATFTGAGGLRDSVWVVARTPTGLTDSTRVHIVPAASRLSMVAGNNQTGPMGAPLPVPLEVRVLDELAGGFRGKAVAWSVTAGTATLSSASVTSNDSGYAAITVTPTSLGAITVRASATGLTGTPQAITFDLTGASSGPSAIAIVSGSDQVDTVAHVLPLPLVVRVTDGLGAPVSGAEVSWLRFYGAGTPSAASTFSDGQGVTQVTYTLGPTPGVDSIRATAVGTPASIVFVATGVAGSVRQVVLDRVVDTIAKGTGLQYNATLRDSAGNPVSGVVTWSSTAPTVASVNTTGLVAAVAGGVTNIIASSGGYADTAALYVRAVASVVVSPADTIVTAVGDSLDLVATAFDNFGGVMSSGVVIRFTSATPTIASVNSVSGRVGVTGAGNAVILARDTVSGLVGSATVRVIQAVAGMANTPADSIRVGVGGRGQIQARALDRNGYPIAGKTFGWRIGDPAVASVDAAGVVTGVALGSTYAIDSLVDGATIYHDSTLVSVVPVPPALIQWAFDSVAVGNGGNISVALSLSRTDSLPLIVKLESSDTLIARPQTRAVTFPAFTSGTSVIINGLTSGRVTLVASDSSGAGYQSDTMVVTVVSTIEFREIGQFFRQTNFYTNQGETRRAQVFLSDPAPAGGLGVTFVYGQGITAVTPSPVVIPAGQLAADVVIEGLAPGRDSIVPTSGSFVGRFSYVDVAPNALQLVMPFPYTLGVGQATTGAYVAITYTMDHPLVVSLSLSPANGTVPDTVTIPAGINYRYFPITATALGVSTLTVSAPGWTSDSDSLTFTTPRLGASGTGSLVAGDPSLGYWTASVQDSQRYSHPITDTVTITAVSRNPAAVVVDAPTGSVFPGQSGVSVFNALRTLPAAGGDSAWIVLTAPGHLPDSFLVRVTPPTLTYVLSYPYVTGVGTYFQNAGYVQIPYVRPDTAIVVFSHTRPGLVTGPDTVRILPGTTYRYFDIAARDTVGVDTISVVQATGYVLPGPQVFQTLPLKVHPYSYPSTLFTISRPQRVQAYVADSFGFTHPLLAPMLVSLTSTDPSVFSLDSAVVTIDSGQAFSEIDTLRVVGVGSSRILVGSVRASPDSTPLITVNPTPLTLQLAYPYAAGRGLRLDFNYVYLPDLPPDTVRVAIQRFNPAVTSLSTDTVKIAPNTTSSPYFSITALDSLGTDSIVASAPGFLPSVGTFSGVAGQIDIQDIGSNHLTTEPPLLVTTYTRMRPPPGYTQPTVSAVTFSIVSTDSSVIQIDSAGVVSPTAGSGSSTVDSGRYYGYFRVRFVGSGTARLIVSAPGFAADTMAQVTVTGPSLRFGYTVVTVGTGQLWPYQYAYVDNPVQGAPLVVRLAKSDSTLPQAQQAFQLSTDSVVIGVGFTSSPVFDITGNTIGTANLIARAPGYSQGLATVQVGAPGLTVTSTMNMFLGAVPSFAGVQAVDQTGTPRPVAVPTTVSSTSSDPAVTTADSASRTIPVGSQSTSFGFRPLQKGAVAVVFTSPGYRPDTMQVIVDSAKLDLVSEPDGLGPNQTAPSQMYVQVPYTSDSALVVSLSASGNVTVPATVTIPAGSNYAYIPVTGVAVGTATVIATAPHSRPDTVSITISTPRLLVSIPAANAGQPVTITVSAQDSTGANRNVTVPVTVTLASSRPGQTAFTTNPITIDAGTYFAQTPVTFDSAGSYTVTATASGYTAGNGSTTVTGALVRMQGIAFVPQSVSIRAGQYVTWRNSDAVSHTTTSDSPFWDGALPPGGTYPVYFNLTGTFSYHCSVHPAMTGTVTVTP